MLHRIVSHLSYANVVASLALFLALGGVGFAATKLPKNSVGPSALRKNAVVTEKIANNAVTGAKVKTASLDGTDINLTKLGTVPAATTATTATTATGIAKVTYKSTTVAVPAIGYGSSFGGTPSASATGTARCDAGQSVLGGGTHVDSDADEIVNDSHPDGTSGWTSVVFNNSYVTPHSMTVYAICAPVNAVG